MNGHGVTSVCGFQILHLHSPFVTPVKTIGPSRAEATENVYGVLFGVVIESIITFTCLHASISTTVNTDTPSNVKPAKNRSANLGLAWAD
jgi:hypothetical protein